jgi:hypothetical protein
MVLASAVEHASGIVTSYRCDDSKVVVLGELSMIQSTTGVVVPARFLPGGDPRRWRISTA